MIIENLNIMILKAEEGYTLTNGEAFGKTIHLGKNDSKDNWREITDAEAEALQNIEEVENNNVLS